MAGRMSAPSRGPSLFDIIFIIWVVVVPVGFGYRLLNSDGDLARHLRLGEIMLDQHGLAPDGRVLLHQRGPAVPRLRVGQRGALRRAPTGSPGLAGVAVLAGLVLALTYALVARFLIRRGGDPLLAYLVSMAAAVLSAAHWLARPHLFTMLLVVVLLELLRASRAAAPSGCTSLLFVVWANLHGGFFFGCILIGLYAAGEAARRTALRGDRRAPGSPARATTSRRSAWRWLASLLNPNGLRAAGARRRLLRQQRHPAADPGVHVARLPDDQREDLPAGAARGHRRPRLEPAAAAGHDAAGPAGQRSPSPCSRSGTSSCSR